MPTLRTACLGLVVASSLTAACADLTPGDGTSGGDGKADGDGSVVPYIQANSPFYWGPSSYADFTAAYQSLGGNANPPPIATDDALTQRLQMWLDRIDTVVRTQVEQELGVALVAPKPILQVLPSHQIFNAWVSPTVACTGVQLAGSAPDMPSQSFVESGSVVDGATYACVHPSYPGGAEFSAFWNRHKPACRVGPDGMVSGSGCQVQHDGAVGEISVLATSPYIHISTDLIQRLSERTLVVVLAHELGHYYRAHVTDATLQKYNFWYDDDVERKKLPVPAANAQALQDTYSAIVNGPKVLQSTTPGIYSARLRTFILTQIAPLLSDRHEANFVCHAARDALGPWVNAMLEGYGTPTDATQAYLAFETKLAACAPSLDLSADPGATAIDAGTVVIAMLSSRLPSASFPLHATLADVLGALNTKAVKLDQKAAALVKQVQQNQIGLYTIEEEADDIALQISTHLGITGDQVVQSWDEFMHAVADSVPDYYKPQYLAENTSCETMLANNFTTTDGSGNTVAAFVAIGDLSEPHHSDCYRLFNFWREQKLREYVTTTTAVFDPGWDALQAEAAQLSAQASP